MRTGDPIERVGTLDKDVFLEEYAEVGRPLIITDLIEAWPARHDWNPEYLIERCGDHRFNLDNQNFTAETLFTRLTQPGEAPTPYLHNHYLEEQLPHLPADVTPMPELLRDNWLWHPRLPRHPLSRKGRIGLFIGGPGSAFPVLHRDNFHTHAFIFQIYGTKRVWLYHPNQSEFLYVHPLIPCHSTIEAPHQLDRTRYPDFAKAKPLTATLAPGETLFVPDNWWHATYMEDLSISLSLNMLNHTNFKGFAADCRREWQRVSPIKAWLRYLRLRAFAARVTRTQAAG
ncbi:cupin-like domain-containing protein [Acanthopleuribacter pedis]|uniref:Cupin-like domain-containing protein n=1 Tax=Acanthopleuribacter pedis TaxID=442870 RepID=A0A8J7U4T0_9BACT|nr:cupin-like domain-containing protein [Acanthopleuribacter pedis]MBO1320972.1 cupin-like domain-containing protein [Acanthopleuribacter pedis]